MWYVEVLYKYPKWYLLTESPRKEMCPAGEQPEDTGKEVAHYFSGNSHKSASDMHTSVTINKLAGNSSLQVQRLVTVQFLNGTFSRQENNI